MRIAFFTDDYLPYLHGVVTSIQNYRQALEALGHEVFIVAPKYADYEDNDDHIIRLRSVNTYLFDKRSVSLIYPGMARKFDDYKFDVIHSQTQFYIGTLGHMVAKRQCIPHVTTLHTLFTELIDDYPVAVVSGMMIASIGFPIAFKSKPIVPATFGMLDAIRSGENKEFLKQNAWKVMNTFLNNASCVVTPSKHLQDTLLQHGMSSPSVVLPNGVDGTFYRQSHGTTLPFKKARGEKIIVSVGRLSGEKRHKVLIEAMAALRDMNVRLVLVGDGPDAGKLQKLAARLHVADKVVFTGRQSRDEVADILQAADVFAMSSYRFDNQPMVILEAIASGLPIVYCDDNLREGLTDGNSMLTHSHLSPAFADAFTELLADTKRLKAMRAASLKVSADFDSLELAKRLIRLYRKVEPLGQAGD